MSATWVILSRATWPSFKYSGRTVNELIAAGLPITAELGLYAMLVALFVGIAAGVIATIKPNTAQDYIPMSAAMIGMACPPSCWARYWCWYLVFSWSGCRSPAGDIPGDKILPSITLGAGYAAYIARLSRGGMLEVLSRTIFAPPGPEAFRVLIIFKHAIRGG